MISKIETSSDEELSRLICIKIKYVADRFDTNTEVGDILNDLVIISGKRVDLFRREDIFKSVCSWLQTSSLDKKVKSCNPNLNPSIVAGNIVYTLIRNESEWNIDLLSAFLEDSFGGRLWVDCKSLSLFSENILAWIDVAKSSSMYENFKSQTYDEEEEELLDGEVFITKDETRPPISTYNRFKSQSRQSLVEMVLQSITRALSSSSESGISGTAHTTSLISSLVRFVSLIEVREQCSKYLERWFLNPALSDPCVRLIQAIIEAFPSGGRDGAGNCVRHLSHADPASTQGAVTHSLLSLHGLDSELSAPDLCIVRSFVHMYSKIKISLLETYRTLLVKMARKNCLLCKTVFRSLLSAYVSERLPQYQANNISTSGAAEGHVSSLKLFAAVMAGASRVDGVLFHLTRTASSGGDFCLPSGVKPHIAGSILLGQAIGEEVNQLWRDSAHQQSVPLSSSEGFVLDLQNTYRCLLDCVLAVIKALGGPAELSLVMLMREAHGLADPRVCNDMGDMSLHLDRQPIPLPANSKTSRSVFSLSMNQHSTSLLTFLSSLSQIVQMMHYADIVLAGKELSKDVDKLSRQQGSTDGEAGKGGRGGTLAGRSIARGGGTAPGGVKSLAGPSVRGGRGSAPAGRGGAGRGRGGDEGDSTLKGLTASQTLDAKRDAERNVRVDRLAEIASIQEASIQWLVERYLIPLFEYMQKAYDPDTSASPGGVDSTATRQPLQSKVPFLIDHLHRVLCLGPQGGAYSHAGSDGTRSSAIADVDSWTMNCSKDNGILNTCILSHLVEAILMIGYIEGIDVVAFNHMARYALKGRGSGGKLAVNREISVTCSYSLTSSYSTNLQALSIASSSLASNGNAWTNLVFDGRALVGSGLDFICLLAHRALRSKYDHSSSQSFNKGLLVQSAQTISMLFNAAMVPLYVSDNDASLEDALSCIIPLPILHRRSGVASAFSVAFPASRVKIGSDSGECNALSLGQLVICKSLFWKVCALLVVFSCVSTDDIGSFAWENIPVVRTLLMCLMSGGLDAESEAPGDVTRANAIEMAYESLGIEVKSLFDHKSKKFDISSIVSWLGSKDKSASRINGRSDVDASSDMSAAERAIWRHVFSPMLKAAVIDVGVHTAEEEVAGARAGEDGMGGACKALEGLGDDLGERDDAGEDSSENGMSGSDGEMSVSSAGAEDAVGVLDAVGIGDEVSGVITTHEKDELAADISQGNGAVLEGGDSLTADTEGHFQRKSTRIRTQRFDYKSFYQEDDSDEVSADEILDIGSRKRRLVRSAVMQASGGESEELVDSGSEDYFSNKRRRNKTSRVAKKQAKLAKDAPAINIRPLWNGMDATSSSDYLLVPFACDLLADPPAGLVSGLHQQWDVKYSFGTTLRNCIRPDFIQRVVASDTGVFDTTDLLCASNRVAMESELNKLDALSHWLLPAIHTDMAVILGRISLPASIMLLHVVSRSLVSALSYNSLLGEGTLSVASTEAFKTYNAVALNVHMQESLTQSLSLMMGISRLVVAKICGHIAGEESLEDRKRVREYLAMLVCLGLTGYANCSMEDSKPTASLVMSFSLNFVLLEMQQSNFKLDAIFDCKAQGAKFLTSLVRGPDEWRFMELFEELVNKNSSEHSCDVIWISLNEILKSQCAGVPQCLRYQSYAYLCDANPTKAPNYFSCVCKSLLSNPTQIVAFACLQPSHITGAPPTPASPGRNMFVGHLLEALSCIQMGKGFVLCAVDLSAERSLASFNADRVFTSLECDARGPSSASSYAVDVDFILFCGYAVFGAPFHSDANLLNSWEKVLLERKCSNFQSFEDGCLADIQQERESANFPFITCLCLYLKALNSQFPISSSASDTSLKDKRICTDFRQCTTYILSRCASRSKGTEVAMSVLRLSPPHVILDLLFSVICVAPLDRAVMEMCLDHLYDLSKDVSLRATIVSYSALVRKHCEEMNTLLDSVQKLDAYVERWLLKIRDSDSLDEANSLLTALQLEKHLIGGSAVEDVSQDMDQDMEFALTKPAGEVKTPVLEQWDIEAFMCHIFDGDLVAARGMLVQYLKTATNSRLEISLRCTFWSAVFPEVSPNLDLCNIVLPLFTSCTDYLSQLDNAAASSYLATLTRTVLQSPPSDVSPTSHDSSLFVLACEVMMISNVNISWQFKLQIVRHLLYCISKLSLSRLALLFRVTVGYYLQNYSNSESATSCDQTSYFCILIYVLRKLLTRLASDGFESLDTSDCAAEGGRLAVDIAGLLTCMYMCMGTKNGAVLAPEECICRIALGVPIDSSAEWGEEDERDMSLVAVIKHVVCADVSFAVQLACVLWHILGASASERNSTDHVPSFLAKGGMATLGQRGRCSGVVLVFRHLLYCCYCSHPEDVLEVVVQMTQVEREGADSANNRPASTDARPKGKAGRKRKHGTRVRSEDRVAWSKRAIFQLCVYAEMCAEDRRRFKARDANYVNPVLEEALQRLCGGASSSLSIAPSLAALSSHIDRSLLGMRVTPMDEKVAFALECLGESTPRRCDEAVLAEAESFLVCLAQSHPVLFLRFQPLVHRAIKQSLLHYQRGSAYTCGPFAPDGLQLVTAQSQQVYFTGNGAQLNLPLFRCLLECYSCIDSYLRVTAYSHCTAAGHNSAEASSVFDVISLLEETLDRREQLCGVARSTAPPEARMTSEELRNAECDQLAEKFKLAWCSSGSWERGLQDICALVEFLPPSNRWVYDLE